MRRLTIALAAAALLLTGCSSAEPTAHEPTANEPTAAAETSTGPTAQQSLLAEYDLAGMEVTQVIDHLDRLGGAERPTGLKASVRVDELQLSDDTREVALDLPDDRFYLSIAPYVTRTHECFYHSLTTCQGELAGEDVHVTVRDDATGAVLVDEQRTTFENGFVGLWLPRDVAGTVRVSADGRTGEVPFSTGDEGATCLTTLQLA